MTKSLLLLLLLLLLWLLLSSSESLSSSISSYDFHAEPPLIPIPIFFFPFDERCPVGDDDLDLPEDLDERPGVGPEGVGEGVTEGKEGL